MPTHTIAERAKKRRRRLRAGFPLATGATPAKPPATKSARARAGGADTAQIQSRLRVERKLGLRRGRSQ